MAFVGKIRNLSRRVARRLGFGRAADAEVIGASALFDRDWYLCCNPDVAAAGLDPLAHFCESGWKEGRHPSAAFDIQWYAQAHLGEAGRGMNPLLHYLRAGRGMGLEIRHVQDRDAAAIRAACLFDADYYLAQYPDVAAAGMDPLAHYLRYGAAEGRNPSAMFDTAYYLRNNPGIAHTGVNPLLHFCEFGWKELRNPGPEFDVWWYWSMHLDPASQDCNPLSHYMEKGRRLGLETRPAGPMAQYPGSGHRHPQDRPLRRLCLFAGHDRDGVVDDYVVDYVRELARHAKVYYLSDCVMRPGELDKLAPHVEGAWAERHGCYDFGSYSRLAARLGWEKLARYDEVLLVNDSCYLLKPLDDVFARMDARPCDWWGLQATKGIAVTRDAPGNDFREPIPIATVKAFLLDQYERDYTYDFLVGSYFLALRGPALQDERVRAHIDSVVAQADKLDVVRKYEIGLTRLLVARGHAFDTYIDDLYPFHPIYTNWYFRLVRDGFPLLKRYLLAENHYRVPRLHTWEQRLRQLLPGVGLDAVKRNLMRLVEPGKLDANLYIGEARNEPDGPVPERLLGDDEFRAADMATPKYPHWWAFPVCAFSGTFSGNERGVFEEVRLDPAIRKIVLTRGLPVQADGENVVVVPLESPEGQYHLMRAGNVFVKHSPTRNLVYPLEPRLHNLINLWHGIPLKRIGLASRDMQARQDAIAREHAKCRAVIASSRLDRLAMASAFHPLTFHDVWVTGLPRNDFILRPLDALPADMREEYARARALSAGRRLVLFMPTFRNGQELSCYRFSAAEIEWLRSWLERNNAVLGIREHMADSAGAFGAELASLAPIDLGQQAFPDAEILYRVADLLVTDYSSCFFDFMLTGKPSVSFAYDHDRYVEAERGLFYDLETVFPGAVCRDFSSLKGALELAFDPPSREATSALALRRAMFFDHVDDRNSRRVVERVFALMDDGATGKEFT